MDWLKTLAPLLGTALGGPLGGAAASFIADKLGIESKTIEAVSEVLNSGKMTPDQISALKLAEIEFQKFLKTHDIKLEEIAAADRDSAREMNKITRSYVPATLTMLITAGFFGVLGWMLYNPIAADSPPLLIMLGQLGTAWGVACAFWFGTTSGSAQKNQLLAQSAPTK
jgi:gas vesicle protein